MARSVLLLPFLLTILSSVPGCSGQVCTSGQCSPAGDAGLALLQSPAAKARALKKIEADADVEGTGSLSVEETGMIDATMMTSGPVAEAGSLRPGDAAQGEAGHLTAHKPFFYQSRSTREPRPSAGRSRGSTRESRPSAGRSHGAAEVPDFAVQASFLDTADLLLSNKIKASDSQVQAAHGHGVEDPPANSTESAVRTKTDAADSNKDDAVDRESEKLQVKMLTSQFKYFSVIALIAAAFFEVVHHRWSGVDWETHDDILDASAEDSAEMTRLSLRGVGSIAYLYFMNDGRVFGTACFLTVSVLIVIGTVVGKKMNVITGIYWDALQEKDQTLFFSGIVCFLSMVPVAFLSSAYESYVKSMLIIHWRQSLTRHLQKLWLENCAFSIGKLRAPDEKRGVENPDQRIEEDVPNFVSHWTELIFGLLWSIPMFVVWMPIVLELSPPHILAIESMPVFRPWLLCAALLWSLFTSVMSHYIGRAVTPLTYARERYNANFRMGLVRIQHNADAIAILHAEPHENRALEGHFERIKRTFWETMHINKSMSIVGFILEQGGTLFPLLTLVHAYFMGGVSLGQFMRVRSAVERIRDSMSFFVEEYVEIAHFRAITKRLNEMMDHCEKVKTTCLLKPEYIVDTTVVNHGMNLIQAQGKLPTGNVLWNIENLVLQEGTWTMVKGVEGSGKTTLMRVLAGAWPVPEATRLVFSKAVDESDAILPGKPSVDETTGVRKPPEILCVPVDAHRLRAQFRLKEAVCYPDPEDAWTDNEVVEVLIAVGLEKLLQETQVTLPEDGTGQRISSASEKEEVAAQPQALLHGDFGDRMLSAGESQRLELAHVLLVRPRWCFLDEPVAHIKESERAALYRTLRDKLKGKTTVVTITHNVSALSSIHDQVFEMRDGGLFKGLFKM